MLSQFTREVPTHRVLGDLGDFPRDVYPVGRLDRDSEGLLVLTNDRRLNDALLNPRHAHPRTYWARVEGTPGPAALDRLRGGVVIRAKGKTHRCAPVGAEVLPPAATRSLPPRVPPVRYRKSVPDAWLSLTLTEGKNRQVRRMCAAVDLPVLRLIRTAIVNLSLADLDGQAVREFSRTELLQKLGLLP